MCSHWGLLCIITINVLFKRRHTMLCYVNSKGVACTSINSIDIFNFIAKHLFLESFFVGSWLEVVGKWIPMVRVHWSIIIWCGNQNVGPTPMGKSYVDNKDRKISIDRANDSKHQAPNRRLLITKEWLSDKAHGTKWWWYNILWSNDELDGDYEVFLGLIKIKTKL